ncbi:alpha/beta hydrolase, partial [Gemmatimonadota bacterium]
REAEGKQEEILKRLDSMALPLLFLVPEADPVVDPGVTTHFVRNLSGGAVQLKGFPGFKHEPFNEVGREEVFEKVGGWLQALRDRSFDLI